MGAPQAPPPNAGYGATGPYGPTTQIATITVPHVQMPPGMPPLMPPRHTLQWSCLNEDLMCMVHGEGCTICADYSWHIGQAAQSDSAFSTANANVLWDRQIRMHEFFRQHTLSEGGGRPPSNLQRDIDRLRKDRDRLREERERLIAENGGVDPEEEATKEKKSKGKGKGKRKKRKRGESDEDEEMADAAAQFAQFDGAGPSAQHPPPFRPPLDPTLLNQGILAGTSQSLPLFLPEEGEELQFNSQHPHPVEPPGPMGPPQVDPALLEPEQTLVNPPEQSQSQPPPPPPPPLPHSDGDVPPDKAPASPGREASPMEETVDAAVTQEVTDFLENAQSTLLNSALDEAEQRRLALYTGDDELLGLDEDELDCFILTEEEVRIKERVWVEMNKDYLEGIAG